MTTPGADGFNHGFISSSIGSESSNSNNGGRSTEYFSTMSVSTTVSTIAEPIFGGTPAIIHSDIPSNLSSSL